MKLHRALTCFLSMAALAAVGFSGTQESDFTYHSPEVGIYKIAGVCYADPQKITCWKPNGESNPDLSELVSAYYLVNPQQKLEIRYKRRSLLIATKSELVSGLYGGNGLTAETGGQLNGGIQIGYNSQGDEQTNFYWYYPSEDATSVNLKMQFQIRTGTDSLPLKVGASAKINGHLLTITGIRKLAEKEIPEVNGMKAKGPRWSVTYSVDPPSTNSPYGFYPAIMAADGNQVSNVDDKGNPSGPSNREGFNPFMQILVPAGNGWTLAVNPDKVGTLQFSEMTTQTADFKGVALQPK